MPGKDSPERTDSALRDEVKCWLANYEKRHGLVGIVSGTNPDLADVFHPDRYPTMSRLIRRVGEVIDRGPDSQREMQAFVTSFDDLLNLSALPPLRRAAALKAVRNFDDLSRNYYAEKADEIPAVGYGTAEAGRIACHYAKAIFDRSEKQTLSEEHVAAYLQDVLVDESAAAWTGFVLRHGLAVAVSRRLARPDFRDEP